MCFLLFFFNWPNFSHIWQLMIMHSCSMLMCSWSSTSKSLMSVEWCLQWHCFPVWLSWWRSWYWVYHVSTVAPDHVRFFILWSKVCRYIFAGLVANVIPWVVFGHDGILSFKTPVWADEFWANCSGFGWFGRVDQDRVQISICDFLCNEFADITNYVKGVVCRYGFGSNMIFEGKNVIKVCTKELYTAKFFISDLPMQMDASSDLSNRDLLPHTV